MNLLVPIEIQWQLHYVSNWKKAIAIFREHESSRAHRDSMAAFTASRITSVSEILLKDLDEIQAKRRCSLLKQLEALGFLLQ